MASTEHMTAALSRKRTTTQVVLTVVRVGDGMASMNSLSVGQIMHVVFALTGGAGPSKRPFVNPTSSFCHRSVNVLGLSCSHDRGPN